MQVGLGIAVLAADGDQVGVVRRLVVNPATNTLSHVVISRPPSDHDLIAVPVWAVVRAEDGEVTLQLDAERVSRLPAFGSRHGLSSDKSSLPLTGHEPGEFPALFPEDGRLPAGSLALGGAVSVDAQGETVGELAAVFADDYTAEVTALIVRLQEGGRLVEVPTAWARQMSDHRISLGCSPADLSTLPDTAWQPAA